VFKVVENPQKKDNIEVPEVPRRQLTYVTNDIVGPRFEQVAQANKFFALDEIQCHYLRPPALHLKGKPAVPSPHIQDTLAPEVFGNGKLRQPCAQIINAL